MKYSNLKIGLIFVVAAALVFAISAPVSAFEAKLSGQINRALVWADDGTHDEVFHVDNEASSTRIRVTGSEEIDGLGTVGIKGEWQFESNSSNDIKFNELGGFTSTNNFTERHMDIYFKTSVGKFSIGQGDTASNGSSEVDLSGTDVVNYSSVADMAAGIDFLDPAISTPTSIGTVGGTRSNFDGFSRDDRFRYDTTYLGPLTVSASGRQNDEYDVAVRYAAELGGLGKIAAAAAYALGKSTRYGGVGYDQFSSSASLLHESGFNVTVAYAMRDLDASGPTVEDPETIFVKLGLKGEKHAFSVHWSTTDDQAAKGDEAQTIGAGYVYDIVKGVQLYAGFNIYELDRTGVSGIDDVTAVMTGARVKF
jgi:hypothetical protein